MKRRFTWLLSVCTLPFFALAAAEETSDMTVVPAKDVQWGYLNPLRGDKSPGAANLWGDRTRNTATGMLVRFNKGFASPPHIHNISYRGIVINGLMHNDDPQAEKLWMPGGSFWTQPAGENHITAANGEENLIYLEIDSGPYLVKPFSAQFDNGEKPINVHRDNLVWLDHQEIPALKLEGISISYLWGNTTRGQRRGTLLALPGGFQGRIQPSGKEFRLVVINGNIQLIGNQTPLPAGSYLGVHNGEPVKLSNGEPALLYIRSDADYSVL